jgi:hypothetical protein
MVGKELDVSTGAYLLDPRPPLAGVVISMTGYLVSMAGDMSEAGAVVYWLSPRPLPIGVVVSVTRGVVTGDSASMEMAGGRVDAVSNENADAKRLRVL